MSVLSKHFKVAMSSATCRDIVHPHTNSCVLAALGYFLKPFWTTIQFFVPLFMVSVAAKRGKLDWDLFTQMMRNLVGAVSASLLTGSMGTMFMCILYNFFNRFHLYSMVAIPGFLGALSIFAVPNAIAVMFSHSSLVMAIEVMIKRRGSIFFKCLDRVIWFRTAVFMALSAIILDSSRKTTPNISWFIQPVKKRSKRRFEKYNKSPIFDSVISVSGNVCSHKKGCDEYVLSELKTYCQIGIAIELIRSILNNIGNLKSNLCTGIWAMIRNFNMKFLLFAIGYPSGYRILTCYFNRLYGFETKFGNFFSALLAGSFFYFYPKLSFLSYAIACTIEILWQRALRNKHEKFNFVRQMNKLPLARISYPIFMSFLFHMRSFYPWQTPSLIQKVMNFVTCRHEEQMLMNCYSFLIPSYS